MEYRQLTEKLPTGILVITNDVIVYANPAFAAFSGYNDTETTGKNLTFFIDTSDHEAFR